LQINLIKLVIKEKGLALTAIGRPLPMRTTMIMHGLSSFTVAMWAATVRTMTGMSGALGTDNNLIFDFKNLA